MNTRIEYLYRDGSNYKAFNTAVVSGTLSQPQIDRIYSCLEDGERFIPRQVGLPEKRFDDGITADDGPWFELYDIEGIVPTEAEPDTDLTAEGLVKNFEEAKGRWDDSWCQAY